MDAAAAAVRPVPSATFASYPFLVESYRRSLRSENKSPRTIEAYDEAHRRFSAFLAAQGMPLDVPHIRREHVEAFLGDLHTRYKPATDVIMEGRIATARQSPDSRRPAS